GTAIPRTIRTARIASAAATNRPSTVLTEPSAIIVRTKSERTPAASAISRGLKTSGTLTATEDMELCSRGRGKTLAEPGEPERRGSPVFSADIRPSCCGTCRRAVHFKGQARGHSLRRLATGDWVRSAFAASAASARQPSPVHHERGPAEIGNWELAN